MGAVRYAQSGVGGREVGSAGPGWWSGHDVRFVSFVAAVPGRHDVRFVSFATCDRPPGHDVRFVSFVAAVPKQIR